MKRLLQCSFILNLACVSTTFALNPVGGLYAGGIAVISHGPSSYVLPFRQDNLDFVGTVFNSGAGGGGGLQLGYRFRNFRVEAEGIFNYIGSSTLVVDGCTLRDPNILTPTGVCPQDNFLANSLGFNGSSTAVYGMFNVYWDFFTQDSETSIVPFIGFGIGQGRVKNSVNFAANRNTTVSCINSTCGGNVTATSGAAQIIAGASVFLDDYAWVGMDYRYLTTNSLTAIQNSRYSLQTLNFTINFAFDNCSN